MVDARAWPTILDTDDLTKKRLTAVYKAPTPEMICYIDFSVSTTGMLAGVKVIIRICCCGQFLILIKAVNPHIQHISFMTVL